MRKKSPLRHQYRRVKQFYKQELASREDMPLSMKLTSWLKGYRARSYQTYKALGTDVKQCIPDLTIHMKGGWINGPYSKLCSDKVLFERVMRTHVDVPPVLGLIRQGVFLPLKQERRGASLSDLIQSYQDRPGLVFKPKDGNRGYGIVIVRYREGKWLLNGQESNLEQILESLANRSNNLACEFVQQASYADKIYPHSCNTVRLITYIDPDTNECYIPMAYHRFGTECCKPLDNVSQGGFFAKVDVESGVMVNAGIRDHELGWKRIERHPDTQEQVVGVEIPGWHAMVERVKQLVNDLQVLKYIGWDVVITDDGFYLIEANATMDLSVIQAEMPFLSNPRTKRFFEYYGVVKS